ncbi:hypothetical protein C8R43DRAFT_1131941 [Mycena crocata]|nr:hypothetical protein C8R43DRAFT_1131941 [Mycena crocata]
MQRAKTRDERGLVRDGAHSMTVDDLPGGERLRKITTAPKSRPAPVVRQYHEEAQSAAQTRPHLTYTRSRYRPPLPSKTPSWDVLSLSASCIWPLLTSFSLYLLAIPVDVVGHAVEQFEDTCCLPGIVCLTDRSVIGSLESMRWITIAATFFGLIYERCDEELPHFAHKQRARLQWEHCSSSCSLIIWDIVLTAQSRRMYSSRILESRWLLPVFIRKETAQGRDLFDPADMSTFFGAL